MTPEELRTRTAAFAVTIAKTARQLPDDDAHRHAVAQLVRSCSSMAANYRATGQARSRAEFVSKMGIVVEEADETVFWVEYLANVGHASGPSLSPLLDEARQLVRIFVRSRQTARRNLSRDRLLATYTTRK